MTKTHFLRISDLYSEATTPTQYPGMTRFSLLSPSNLREGQRQHDSVVDRLKCFPQIHFKFESFNL